MPETNQPNQTAILTLEQILQADDRKPVAVECPEWGGSVNVYPLTPAQLEDMEAWNDDNPLGHGNRLKLLSLALADYEFKNENDERLLKLADKNAAVIRRLAIKATELIDPDLGTQVKNFETDDDDESG